MSLRRKILFKDLALLASLLLMIGFTLWGLLRQRQHVQASLNEYTALQKVEEAETHLVAFQQRLHAGALNEPNAMAELQAASLNLRQYKAIISQYNSILPPEITAEEQQQAKTKTDPLVRSLVSLTKQLAPPVNASKTDLSTRHGLHLLTICASRSPVFPSLPVAR
jgi:hypothetical protein